MGRRLYCLGTVISIGAVLCMGCKIFQTTDNKSNTSQSDSIPTSIIEKEYSNDTLQTVLSIEKSFTTKQDTSLILQTQMIEKYRIELYTRAAIDSNSYFFDNILVIKDTKSMDKIEYCTQFLSVHKEDFVLKVLDSRYILIDEWLSTVSGRRLYYIDLEKHYIYSTKQFDGTEYNEKIISYMHNSKSINLERIDGKIVSFPMFPCKKW